MGDFALENPFSWDIVSVVMATVLASEREIFLSFQRGQLILCFREQLSIQSPRMTTRTNPNRRFRYCYVNVSVLVEWNLEVPELCGGFDDY